MKDFSPYFTDISDNWGFGETSPEPKQDTSDVHVRQSSRIVQQNPGDDMGYVNNEQRTLSSQGCSQQTRKK